MIARSRKANTYENSTSNSSRSDNSATQIDNVTTDESLNDIKSEVYMTVTAKSKEEFMHQQSLQHQKQDSIAGTSLAAILPASQVMNGNGVTTVNNKSRRNHSAGRMTPIMNILKRKLNQKLSSQSLLTAVNDRRTLFEQNYAFYNLLLINVLERFAFYGIICNYVLYLNTEPLEWDSYNAAQMVLILFGLTYLLSLIGGWIADSLFGKYKTILIGFIFYIVGYLPFPLIAYSDKQVPGYCNYYNATAAFQAHTTTSNVFTRQLMETYDSNSGNFVPIKPNRALAYESCSWAFILSAVLMSLGVGFFRSNLGPFGADQVISRGEQVVFKYFNWLYWCTNLGSLLSFSALAYLQQNVSFFIGYLIPFCLLVLSFILFLSGNFSYIKCDSGFSVLTNIFQVFIEAFRSSRRQHQLLKRKQREKAFLSNNEYDESDDYENDNVSESASVHSSYYDSVSEPLLKSTFSLDYAKIRFGGQFDDNLVEDIKSLRKIILLFAILIPYWIVYFQIETTFVLQGLHMRLVSSTREEKHLDFLIPTAWLSIADQVAVLFMIPILNSFVYPFIRKHMGDSFAENKRIVLGMSFSSIGVILAGLLETERISIFLSEPPIIQVIDNTTYYAANLHIAWQIPQYFVIGLGEVFCSVTTLYIAYSAAPKSMQSVLMGFFYFFSGLGSIAGTLLLSIFKSFIYSSSNTDDINCSKCRLNWFFYILALIQFIGTLIYIYANEKWGLTRAALTSSSSVNNDNANNSNYNTFANEDADLDESKSVQKVNA